MARNTPVSRLWPGLYFILVTLCWADSFIPQYYKHITVIILHPSAIIPP